MLIQPASSSLCKIAEGLFFYTRDRFTRREYQVVKYGCQEMQVKFLHRAADAERMHFFSVVINNLQHTITAFIGRNFYRAYICYRVWINAVSSACFHFNRCNITEAHTAVVFRGFNFVINPAAIGA